MDESKFFKCDCHSHGMEILVDEIEGTGEKELLVMLWKYNPNDTSSPFWSRLKTAFEYVFRKKNLYSNEVILNKEKSLELSAWIKEKIEG
jgi:hypothetical protein